jgi:hypothetical protein
MHHRSHHSRVSSWTSWNEPKQAMGCNGIYIAHCLSPARSTLLIKAASTMRPILLVIVLGSVAAASVAKHKHPHPAPAPAPAPSYRPHTTGTWHDMVEKPVGRRVLDGAQRQLCKAAAAGHTIGLLIDYPSLRPETSQSGAPNSPHELISRLLLFRPQTSPLRQMKRSRRRRVRYHAFILLGLRS